MVRQKRPGEAREVEFRQIANAVLYLVFTGCGWRFLPTDFPKWQTVYYYFAKWKTDGTWYRSHETLRSRERKRAGRNKHPSAGCADSQTVKTTAVPSSGGFDGGKKIMGRKRHILVNTLGLMIALTVTTAAVQDRDRLKTLLRTFGVHRKKLRKVWVDGDYRGKVIE